MQKFDIYYDTCSKRAPEVIKLSILWCRSAEHEKVARATKVTGALTFMIN